MCGKIETVEPYIRPPWWTPTAKTRIEITKNDAKDLHDRIQTHPDDTTITIYTDGSGINNKIGAAVYNATAGTTNYQYLGSEAQFNVYAAELRTQNTGRQR